LCAIAPCANGTLPIKDRVIGIKEIIKSLIRKAEGKGDPSVLRARNIELTADLKVLRGENESRKKETEMLKRTKEDLKKEVAELRRDKERSNERSRKYERVITTNTERDPAILTEYIRWNERQAARKYEDGPSKLGITEREKDGNGRCETRNKYGKVSMEASDGIATERIRGGNTARENLEDRFTEQRYKEEERAREYPALEYRIGSPYGREDAKKSLPKREMRIRVKEDIQIRPPFDSEEREDGAPVEIRTKEAKERTRFTGTNGVRQERDWETVTRKRSGNARAWEGRSENDRDYRNRNNGGRKLADSKVRRRPPKTVVIAIKGEKEGFSYADALKKARTEISLKEIGIGVTKIRKATNGGIIIEIPGAENKDKANLLVQKLKQVLPAETKITRPSIKGELRVVGFDESVSAEEIKETIAADCECDFDEISVNDIMPMRNGLYMTWIRCPLAAAAKIANNGRIKIGWSLVRAELLEARPKQCYKCWEFGHTKGVCRSDIDRSALCFKCGKKGHSYKDCKNELHCILCAQEGGEANHRIGSFRCKASKRSVNEKKYGINETRGGSLQAERRSVTRSPQNGSADTAN